MRIFIATWLCGWAAGEFLVSQVIQAMVLCGGDSTFEDALGLRLGSPGGLVDAIASDPSLNKAVAVPFLTAWLAAWSCGGISVLQVLLGTTGRFTRIAPIFVVWVVTLLAFQRNVPALEQADRCRSPTTWIRCWLLLPPLLAALAHWRGRRRCSGRWGRNAGPAGLFASDRAAVCEVSPRGLTLRSRFRAAFRTLCPSRAQAPSPDAVRQAAADLRQLYGHGELATCAICFSPLCMEQCAALTRPNRQRTCGHYFHLACVRRMARFDLHSPLLPACPLCRRTYLAWTPVPDLASHPAAWFQTADVDGDGRLSEAELVEACAMALPLESERLRGRLRSNMGGDRLLAGIGWEDFSAPQVGLLEWLLAARAAARSRAYFSTEDPCWQISPV